MGTVKRLLAAAGFVACGQMGLMAQASARITLGLSDWPGWVAWYVAQHNGYLKKYGAHVRLVWFPSYMTSVEALSAGRIDANCQALIDTIAPIVRKVPIKVILVTDNSAGNDALMVNNTIHSFAGLKGKSIAVEMNSIEEYLDVTALHEHHMGVSDVHFVNMSTGNSAAALITGRVAAAGVWNPWIQRIEARRAGHPLFTSAQAPGLIPDLVVARAAVVAAHKKDFVGLAKAWFATVRFIKAHPRQAARIMAPHVDLTPAVYAESLSGTRLFGAHMNRVAMNPGGSPASLYNSTIQTTRFLRQVKMVNATPSPRAFIDAGIVNQAAR
ncbi:ABC transporter substrate-binding protein [Acidiferrobacter sp.]|uniref:ABC transporter substrate-binding protein n=1 Tax=Acidiferrobacter sp. TaxID=1872107 RepID=UPI0026113071|nr:ABC transporter substrate-binding protein [Acidiferrobacter sp.]